MLGFRNGWRGVMDGDVRELTKESVQGILHRGGTILGSSGADPYHEGGTAKVRRTFADLALDGLIAIGGEGTLGAAAHMTEEGLPVVGVPKTIDNDLSGTDACIGFATAVQIATDAIDRLHSTAESHHRVMLVEVMGRSAGWIAVSAGLAGGADLILIPERPFDLSDVCVHLRRRHLRGHLFSIVVVAEGAQPVEGSMERPEYPVDARGFPRFGGIANLIAPEIERRTGHETRVTVLGHVQRGGFAGRGGPDPRHEVRDGRDRSRTAWRLGRHGRAAGSGDRRGSARRRGEGPPGSRGAVPGRGGVLRLAARSEAGRSRRGCAIAR